MWLTEDEWRAREDAHATRLARWVEPHRRRRSHGEKHAVWDFLFTYYSHPASQLARWQPGPGVVLAGDAARRFLDRKGYREVSGGVELDPGEFGEKRQRAARAALVLLEATASRQPRLNCFGLHEWAMVYRQPAERRHGQLPLRLAAEATDDVVDSLDVRCGHYDAFRFFTEPARPLNTLQPTADTRRDLEQPGCLHASMDLYKWCYKLGPFAPSELLADCFELAADVRLLDMRASPYDLSSLGYSPVPIETPRGRAEYARQQAELAGRATPLRARLIEHYRSLLGAR